MSKSQTEQMAPETSLKKNQEWTKKIKNKNQRKKRAHTQTKGSSAGESGVRSRRLQCTRVFLGYNNAAKRT